MTTIVGQPIKCHAKGMTMHFEFFFEDSPAMRQRVEAVANRRLYPGQYLDTFFLPIYNLAAEMPVERVVMQDGKEESREPVKGFTNRDGFLPPILRTKED